MRKATTTIYNIADALGINPSTVSRALRKQPNLKPETVEKVLKMAKKLNYKPNAIAQSLKERKTKLLGVLLPNVSSHLYVSMLNGIEDTAFRKNYSVICCKSDETYPREVACLENLAGQADGVIACVAQQTSRYDHFRQLRQQNLPLVFAERAADKIAAHKVLFNDAALAFSLTEHLINVGYRRIALLTGPLRLKSCQDRRAGYRQALEQYRLPVVSELITHVGLQVVDGQQAVRHLMQTAAPPDALLADGDALGLAAYTELAKHNVVHEIGLAVFGSDPVFGLLQPGVTAIRSRGYEMGCSAAQLCIQQIEQTTAGAYRTDRLTSELVIRQSTLRGNESYVVNSYSNYHLGNVDEEVKYIY